jgi:polar amino acid transport system substrate-binding protein
MNSQKLSWILGVVLLGMFLVAPAVETGLFAKSTLDEILEKGVVRIGWMNWPPHAFMNKKTNQVDGIARDLGEELAKALGVKVEFVEDSTAGAIAGLQSGKFDLCTQLAVTLPRAKTVEFTNPLLRYEASLLVKKESEIKKWQEANESKYTIAVTKGSNTALYVERMFPKATVLEIKQTPDGILAMKAGRAQLFASSYDTLLDIARQNPDLRVLKECFVYNPMGFAVRKGDQVFVNWLNWFIEDLKVTHTIHKILEKHGARPESVAELIYR